MFRRQLILRGGNRSYQEITLTFFGQMNRPKIRFLHQRTKGKAIKLSARARSGFYELAWFIFPGKGSEWESFPLLLRSFRRIRRWSIRAKLIHHEDQNKHLNTKHIFLISNSDDPTWYVIFLKPLVLSGKYLKRHFIGEFNELDMQNKTT